MKSKRRPRGMTLEAWLLENRRIDDASGCWLWTRSTNGGAGYGVVYHDGTRELVHRASYRLFVQAIPDGREICHSCDTPPCFNPEHLFVGTKSENMTDCVTKGRHRAETAVARQVLAQRPELRARGERHGNAKLTAEIAKAIYFDPRSHSQIAHAYGVSQSAVDHVKAGRRWRHVTEPR